ncbi:hypothetical protein EDD30_6641 [Couchioplanes caeruleus]|uniref:Uncharacterized protein n=4 Tax=Couchioplanes caeruleus TaxID=56438 RepID=A0A1K0GPD9_9ACTN|nr:hypothetical protein BG844_17600 [Couchioplanes caeruleus subsp. caeruleus]ROP33624.1 hypothetical protein EDD30_6641 [Couchioplanes caeruleus]
MIGLPDTARVMTAVPDSTGSRALLLPTVRGEETPTPLLATFDGRGVGIRALDLRMSHLPAVVAVRGRGFLAIGTTLTDSADASSGIYLCRNAGVCMLGRLRADEQLAGSSPIIGLGDTTVVTRCTIGSTPVTVIRAIGGRASHVLWEETVPADAPMARFRGALYVLNRAGTPEAELWRLTPGRWKWQFVQAVPDVAMLGATEAGLVGVKRGRRLVAVAFGPGEPPRPRMTFDAGVGVSQMVSSDTSPIQVFQLSGADGRRSLAWLTDGGTAGAVTEPYRKPTISRQGPLHQYAVATSRRTVSSRDTNSFHRDVVPYLQRRGVAVVSVSGSGRDGTFVPHMYVDFLTTRPSEESFVLEGFSIDAVGALLAVIKVPTKVAGVILRFPVSRLSSLVEQPGGWRWGTVLERVDPMWRTRFEPLRMLAGCNGLPPLLLLAGRFDRRVPGDQRALFDEYRARSASPDRCRFVEYDCGHDLHVSTATQERQKRDILQFWNSLHQDAVRLGV